MAPLLASGDHELHAAQLERDRSVLVSDGYPLFAGLRAP